MMGVASPPSQRPTEVEGPVAVGHNVHHAENNWDDEVLEAPRPSSPSGSSDSAALRGGAYRQRPDPVYRPPSDADEDYEEDEDEKYWRDYEIHRRKPKDIPEDDNSSTSSDWNKYGSLPLAVKEYNVAFAELEGSEHWNSEQRKIHKLIYMRGLHPMLPSTWRLSFKMWGITQPELDNVFSPRNSKKRVVIHANGSELEATKALESLFYLSQTVADYEEIGCEDKISRTISKGIRNYINWALRDAGISRSKTQLNMLVREYPPDFSAYAENKSREADLTPSSPIGDSEGGQRKVVNVQVTSILTEEEQQRLFMEAISQDVEKRLRNRGQRWRELLRDDEGRGYGAQPPTLYAFAIVQHIVMVASHDPSDTKHPVVVLEQVRLNNRGHWLWNALALAIPINVARDSLDRLWDTGVIVPAHDEFDPDPDL